MVSTDARGSRAVTEKAPAAKLRIAGHRGPSTIDSLRIPTDMIGASDPEAPGKAASILRSGGVIVYPTETLYGIGALVSNDKSVERVFEIKVRPLASPIPVLGKDRAMLEEVAEFNAAARLLAEKFWPGPLTLVLKDKGRLPRLITAGTGKVAVRVSAHPFVARLFDLLEGPLTSTSANPSGSDNLLDFINIYRAFNGHVELIIDSGNIPTSKGSTVVDVTTTPPEILRQGDLAISKLKECFDADR